jgi:hypothetical protein
MGQRKGGRYSSDGVAMVLVRPGQRQETPRRKKRQQRVCGRCRRKLVKDEKQRVLGKEKMCSKCYRRKSRHQAIRQRMLRELGPGSET